MIESLKDLERLLKLCRKQGVTEISVAGATFKLGELPTKHPNQSIEEQEEEINPFEVPLTNEEMTQWANGALNEN